MSLNEFQRRSYRIVDFRDKPAQVTVFHESGLVTRSNFASLLEKSFSASRGDLRTQVLYFEWIRANTGFNYQLSLKAFLAAGGWRCFTAAERTNLMRSFNKVLGHRAEGNSHTWNQFHTQPAEEFNIQINNVLRFTEKGLISNILNDLHNRGKKLFGLSKRDFTLMINGR